MNKTNIKLVPKNGQLRKFEDDGTYWTADNFYKNKTFINFNKSFILGYICLYFREIREQKIQKFPKMKKITKKKELKIAFF